MEFIECILRCLFLYIGLYIIYDTNMKNNKILNTLLKEEENKKEEELQEQLKNICDELTMLKSLYKKNEETIKQIVKKLPFNGEEWIQEFIREEIEKNYNLSGYDNINQ